MYSILIIDDETLIRRSLVSKITNSLLPVDTIFEADSMPQALSVIHSNPLDIIISDIRLGDHNGLDIIERAKSLQPQLQSIIISGYSEFSYATRALSLKAVEYLLKPVRTKDLIQAVEKCIRTIEEQKKICTKQKVADTIVQTSQVSQLFLSSKEIPLKELSPFLSLAGADSLYITCSRVSFQHYNTDFNFFSFLEQQGHDAIHWAYGRNFTYFQVKQNDFCLVFLTREKNLNLLDRSILAFIENLKQAMQKQKIYSFSIGVGDTSHYVKESYWTATIALNSKISYPEVDIVLYSNCKDHNTHYQLSCDTMTRFKLIIISLDSDKVKQFFDTLYSEMDTEGPLSYQSIQIIYNFLKDTILTLSDYTLESEPFVQNIQDFSSVKEMFRYLNFLFLKTVVSSGNQTGKSRVYLLVDKLKKIIDEQYAENIGLDLFAQENSIATSFLSAQFGKIVQMNYLDYLNQVRINHAMELLKDTDEKIGTIATLCGFSNQHYFSKMFKQKTGTTPTLYKESVREDALT
jgi:two-component system response regulator YesN